MELFESQVQSCPQAVALVTASLEGNRDDALKITYAELNQRANQLAQQLQALGVVPNSLVGLCLERSWSRIVGMLAILKAGAAYLPLEPDYPRTRRMLMIQECQVEVILTQTELKELWSEQSIKLLCLDQESQIGEPSNLTLPTVSATDLAYVMYTSGSTGQPKGVCISHRNILRMVTAVSSPPRESAGDPIFLHLSPFGFDASTFEIWCALLNGGQLVIAPPIPLSPTDLAGIIKRYAISDLWLTTRLFNLMVEQQLESLLGVKHLFFGGEAASASYTRKLLEQWRGESLVNGYGPTECTVFTCFYPLQESDRFEHRVPIGKPLANTQVYVLDRYEKPVPIGVPGELYIGGDGVALGYLNQPELTAARFVPDQFSGQQGAKLYRTGDRVRWREDGNLEFLGRIDRQVKLRGFRVEPGEIEAVLREQPEIADALVVLREDVPGDQRLVAYLIPAAGSSQLDIKAVSSIVQDRLPSYLIPAYYQPLPSLPLNSNGKVDLAALPVPENVNSETPLVAPSSRLEESLVKIWRELLRQEQVGIEDNFFELGGHSLLAAQVMEKINQSLQVELPLYLLFEHPTIASLAQEIAKNPTTQATVPISRRPRNRDRQPHNYRAETSQKPIEQMIDGGGSSRDE